MLKAEFRARGEENKANPHKFKATKLRRLADGRITGVLTSVPLGIENRPFTVSVLKGEKHERFVVITDDGKDRQSVSFRLHDEAPAKAAAQPAKRRGGGGNSYEQQQDSETRELMACMKIVTTFKGTELEDAEIVRQARKFVKDRL